jgi:hypothetical protein
MAYICLCKNYAAILAQRAEAHGRRAEGRWHGARTCGLVPARWGPALGRVLILREEGLSQGY